MAGLTEVSKDVWRWTWFSEEKGLDFNGWAARTAAGLVLIDPAYAGEVVWEALAAIGRPVAVLLTNKDHERASDELRGRFGIPVLIHEADARLLQMPPDEEFNDGQQLFGGLDPIRFRRLKSPGECAFLWKDRGLLFVGDAVTGHPAGSLGLVKKHAGQPGVLEDLRTLLALDFDALLPGDGQPILRGAKAALRTFLSAAGSPAAV